MKEKKKVSIKLILKIIWVIYACHTLVGWLPKVDRWISKDYSRISQYISLDDSWDIAINGEDYPNVSLADFHFPPVNRGDRIVMRRMLPDGWGIVEGALRIHIRQSAIRMYVDGEEIYEYGHDRIAQGKTVGSGLQFINFPTEYQGKALTVDMVLSEDKAFTTFDSMRIYEWENVYRVLTTENRIPMFFGCFLVIFGLSAGMTTIFAVVASLKYVRLLCVSVFSMCMGIWTLCYYNVMMLFSIPLHAMSLLEYMSLYIAPIPLTVYMYEDVKQLKSRFLKILYWIFLTVQLAMIFTVMVLHTTDTVHFAATLKYMHILILVSLGYFFTVVILNLSRSSLVENRLFLLGMLVIGGCITYDIVDYCCNRYLGYSPSTLKGLSSFGVIIFIFILIISFYMNLTKKLMRETERNSLIKSAYTDELTQLHNRRYCMEYMNKVKEGKSHAFTVVCFDLNDLKAVNDTYGHARGDILIKSAAEAIAETFEAHGVVARMGGDEFIAVLETSDEGEMASLLEAFQKNIDAKNQETKGLDMSIAFGCASGSEQESDIDKIYQLADDRMYEHKKQMKQASGELK